MTDHKPLEVIFGPRYKPSPRLERLLIRVQAYNFRIIYVPGKLMLADIFSRLCQENASDVISDNEAEEYLIALVQSNLENAITLEELQEAAKSDDLQARVKQALISGQWEPDLLIYKMCADELYVVDEVLMRGHRIVIPENLREHLLQLGHEGHPGMNKMKSKLRSRFWYPRMDKEIEKFVDKCIACKLVSLPNPPNPMQRTELPDGAWQYLGIDLFGPLPSGEQLLVIVDYYSRFFEVKILTKTETKHVTAAMTEIFARLGLPEKIISDNGHQFRSQEFQDFCKSYGIKLIHSPPYFPRVNGEAERQMRSIKKVITIAVNTGQDWRQDLIKFLFTYRTTPHPVTGVSPAELLLNRKMRDKLPALPNFPTGDVEMRDKDKISKERGKEYGDSRSRARESDVKEGDSVIVKRAFQKTKFDSKYNPTPCKVVALHGPEATVQSAAGNLYNRSVSHLKRIPNSREGNSFVESPPERLEIESGTQTSDQDDTRMAADNINLSLPTNASLFQPPCQSTPMPSRTKRVTKQPAWMKDFTDGKELSMEEGEDV